MNARTEAIIRQITAEVAEECGMKTAIRIVPDRMQQEAKEYARFLLKKTGESTGNSLTLEENDKLAEQMKGVLNQADRAESLIDEEKEREFHAMLDARIKRAIRKGLIPDPKDDPYLRKMHDRLA